MDCTSSTWTPGIRSERGVEHIEGWPTTASELAEQQARMASLDPGRWHRSADSRVGGCFVCFERGPRVPGHIGESGWAAAVVLSATRLIDTAVVVGVAGAEYRPGLLALREGPLLSAALEQLDSRPEVVLVNATGRDHPRAFGLAAHIGAVVDLPTVGVTHRPLLATGSWPSAEKGATSPLQIRNELVGFWVRTQRDARPIAVHGSWRTTPHDAVQIVLDSSSGFRTPAPLREARRLARKARSAE